MQFSVDGVHTMFLNIFRFPYYNGLFHFLPMQRYGRQFSKFTFGLEFKGGDAKNGPIGKQFSRCGPTGRLVLTGTIPLENLL